MVVPIPTRKKSGHGSHIQKSQKGPFDQKPTQGSQQTTSGNPAAELTCCCGCRRCCCTFWRRRGPARRVKNQIRHGTVSRSNYRKDVEFDRQGGKGSRGQGHPTRRHGGATTTNQVDFSASHFAQTFHDTANARSHHTSEQMGL